MNCYLPPLKPTKLNRTRLLARPMSWGSDVPASNYSRPAEFRRRWCTAAPPRPPGRTRGQYSMILVKNGVMPGLRTGLTVTLPALPDASSLWPLPRYMVTGWLPPGP